MSPLTFALVSLAAYRAALAISSDSLTAGLRRRAARRWPPREPEHIGDPPEPHPAVELINCGRCLGVWTAAAATLLAHLLGLAPSWASCALAWPAAAGVVALLVVLAP